MSFLGIDLGTSSVKAVLTDADGRILASGAANLQVSRPQTGWSEQSPQDWLDATAAAIGQLQRSEPALLAQVRGIGLSGQMHGATLIDAADRPLRPAILWNDGRSRLECEDLSRKEPRFESLGGNLVMPGFTAPKLAWVGKHEPEIFERIAKVLLPKDYLRLWLTGDYASDMSDAAGTLWLDIAARKWCEPLLAATGLSRAQMPELFEGTAPSGQLRRDLARSWGIEGQPIVAGGGGDNAASACGIGAVRPGDAFLSLGTSGVLFVANDAFSPNIGGAVHAFCHAVPETWHQMGVILSATASLDWLATVARCRPADLVADISERDVCAIATGDPLFAPYLAGERTPHNDPLARGAFTGLAQSSDRAALTLAVLEGVAFAFADCRDALAAAGTRFDRLTAVGGGSRSLAWLKLIASALGTTIEVPADGDLGAAFGAARLGRIAAEGADPLEICAQPAMRLAVEPDKKLGEVLQLRQQRWQRLYPILQEVGSS